MLLLDPSCYGRGGSRFGPVANGASSTASCKRVGWRCPTAPGQVQAFAPLTGNGAVNALFQAIDAAVGIPCELEEYHVEAVTPGEDAQGQVRLRIRSGGHVYTGHGLATDVVEASARAYLAALSKVVEGESTAVIAGPVSAVSRWT